MKKIKIISIIAILIMLLYTMSTLSLAENKKISTSDYKLDAPYGYNQATEKLSKVVAVLRILGIIAVVAGIIALGIKYMVGSVEERANYKKSLFPYLLGSILVFTIFTVITIIYQLARSLGTGNE